MDEIAIEDLALLEVLKRVDDHVELIAGETEIRKRLLESGLLVEDAEGLRLSTAGVEMCKSLQHRVAADHQVAKIMRQREG